MAGDRRIAYRSSYGMTHIHMLQCGRLIAPAYTHLAIIEAGHLARLDDGEFR
jgi:hypothetical protein